MRGAPFQPKGAPVDWHYTIASVSPLRSMPGATHRPVTPGLIGPFIDYLFWGAPNEVVPFHPS